MKYEKVRSIAVNVFLSDVTNANESTVEKLTDIVYETLLEIEECKCHNPVSKLPINDTLLGIEVKRKRLLSKQLNQVIKSHGNGEYRLINALVNRLVTGENSFDEGDTTLGQLRRVNHVRESMIKALLTN